MEISWEFREEWLPWTKALLMTLPRMTDTCRYRVVLTYATRSRATMWSTRATGAEAVNSFTARPHFCLRSVWRRTTGRRDFDTLHSGGLGGAAGPSPGPMASFYPRSLRAPTPCENRATRHLPAYRSVRDASFGARNDRN